MMEPNMAGSIQSPDTTPTQDEIIAFYGYFAKIAKIVDITHPVIKIEKPEGLQIFLAELEKLKENNPNPDPKEIKKLEDEYRWDTLVSLTLGNSTAILNSMLKSVTNTDSFHTMIERAGKEAAMIAEQSRNTKKFTTNKDASQLI